MKSGDKIRRLRKAKGYTLERLAKLTGSSKSYIWELENKKPPRPSAEKLAKIATALDVTTDYLLGKTRKVEDAVDEAFFRIYQGLDPSTKVKLRRIAGILSGP